MNTKEQTIGHVLKLTRIPRNFCHLIRNCYPVNHKLGGIQISVQTDDDTFAVSIKHCATLRRHQLPHFRASEEILFPVV